jgi:glyoxylase-like metal-dependent hydrolase (beta-lactamase superfamily II)
MRRDMAGLLIERIVVGPMEVNCYIAADPLTKEACIIDPGAEPARIERLLAKRNFKSSFILNTHGHGDHIGANGCFEVPICIHRLDKDFLTDPKKNLSADFGFRIVSPEASRLLEDGERIALGKSELEVIHTPGHTPGSVSIKAGNIVFTGDALFRQGIGRTDFSYGDEALLLRSIRTKLLVLDDDVAIYPGHGESSTIGEERRFYPPSQKTPSF